VRKLVVLALVGLAAQLVDGALGMAYGVTSSTLLLVAGLAPASASASVHLAEIGTTLAAGAAHWRFGNVDWRVVVRIGVRSVPSPARPCSARSPPRRRRRGCPASCSPSACTCWSGSPARW
jgi:sulfite exporter TauE/SafE